MAVCLQQRSVEHLGQNETSSENSRERHVQRASVCQPIKSEKHRNENEEETTQSHKDDKKRKVQKNNQTTIYSTKMRLHTPMPRAPSEHVQCAGNGWLLGDSKCLVTRCTTRENPRESSRSSQNSFSVKPWHSALLSYASGGIDFALSMYSTVACPAKISISRNNAAIIHHVCPALFTEAVLTSMLAIYMQKYAHSLPRSTLFGPLHARKTKFC